MNGDEHIADLVVSHLRLEALAEAARRYGAVIAGLAAAVERALPRVEGEPRDELQKALADTIAQLNAVGDVLDRALEDLPDGQPRDEAGAQ